MPRLRFVLILGIFEVNGVKTQKKVALSNKQQESKSAPLEIRWSSCQEHFAQMKAVLKKWFLSLIPVRIL